MNKLENQQTQQRMMEANNIESLIQEDKRKRQNMYRSMLNNQVDYNKQ